MGKDSRKEYLFQSVESFSKNLTKLRGIPKRKRKHSWAYSLKTSIRYFFRQTTVISSIPVKRGKHDPIHKMSELKKNKIIQHIEPNCPTISHYQKIYAPLWKLAIRTQNCRHSRGFTSKPSSGKSFLRELQKNFKFNDYQLYKFRRRTMWTLRRKNTSSMSKKVMEGKNNSFEK